MSRRIWIVAFAAGAWVMALVAVAGAQQAGARGWNIPATAASEKSPLPATDATVAAGKKLFDGKCQRCHGASGQGDGDDADPARKADMDLTRADRAAANPDGVVFYKIWNGRSSPRMPTFSEQLSKEQAWSIVAYVQSLRKK